MSLPITTVRVTKKELSVIQLLQLTDANIMEFKFNDSHTEIIRLAQAFQGVDICDVLIKLQDKIKAKTTPKEYEYLDSGKAICVREIGKERGIWMPKAIFEAVIALDAMPTTKVYVKQS